ncbi:hypothetical protein D918_03033, partial [Trichuris suis]
MESQNDGKRQTITEATCNAENTAELKGERKTDQPALCITVTTLQQHSEPRDADVTDVNFSSNGSTELKEERKADQPALRETLTGLQEHRKLSGTHIIEVHFRSSRPVFSGGFQQMAANATDPIQELLMVPDEQFENTKETVTQMIRTMDAQNKNSLALSCKQILGYAMQTPRGATRAAEIVD